MTLLIGGPEIRRVVAYIVAQRTIAAVQLHRGAEGVLASAREMDIEQTALDRQRVLLKLVGRFDDALELQIGLIPELQIEELLAGPFDLVDHVDDDVDVIADLQPQGNLLLDICQRAGRMRVLADLELLAELALADLHPHGVGARDGQRTAIAGEQVEVPGPQSPPALLADRHPVSFGRWRPQLGLTGGFVAKIPPQAVDSAMALLFEGPDDRSVRVLDREGNRLVGEFPAQPEVDISSVRGIAPRDIAAGLGVDALNLAETVGGARGKQQEVGLEHLRRERPQGAQVVENEQPPTVGCHH